MFLYLKTLITFLNSSEPHSWHKLRWCYVSYKNCKLETLASFCTAHDGTVYVRSRCPSLESAWFVYLCKTNRNRAGYSRAKRCDHGGKNINLVKPSPRSHTVPLSPHVKFTSLLSWGLIYYRRIVIRQGYRIAVLIPPPFNAVSLPSAPFFQEHIVLWICKKWTFLCASWLGKKEESHFHWSLKDWFCYFPGKVLVQKSIHKMPSCPFRQLVQCHMNAFEKVSKWVVKGGKLAYGKVFWKGFLMDIFLIYWCIINLKWDVTLNKLSKMTI